MKTTLSNEDVLDRIKDVQYHHFHGTTMTVCCLTLDNGFSVVGYSACVDPARFDIALGDRLAFQDAVGKALDHLAFLLREKMHAMDQHGVPYDKGDAFVASVIHSEHAHEIPRLGVDAPSQG